MYTETELAKLIKTVEKEFTSHLSKAEALAKSEGANSAASLSKAEDEKKDKKPSPPKDEGKEAAPAESEESAPPAEAEGEQPPMAAEGEEAAPAAPAEGAIAAPEGGAPAAPGADMAAGHGYDDEDMEHMRQMYASMSREELMAHHDAIRDALDASAAAPAAPGAPAPEAPAAAPGADGMDKCGTVMKSEKGKSEIEDENPELNSKPKAGGKDMNGDAKNGGIEGQSPKSPKNRSEASKDSKNLHDAMSKTERQDRNGGKIDKGAGPKGSPGAKSPASTDQRNLSDMEKSEDIQNDLQKSLEAEQAKSAELKKSLDTVQEFLTKLVSKVSAPKGKAITSLDVIAKSEDGAGGVQEMSKSEVTAKLLQKSADPNLSKSDRAAINAFYLDGANFNTISHLLK